MIMNKSFYFTTIAIACAKSIGWVAYKAYAKSKTSITEKVYIVKSLNN